MTPVAITDGFALGNAFIDDATVLKTLAEHVAANLEERAFCIVFEDDLDRCWPRRGIVRSEREREIQNFAESQGWAATIIEGEFGSRAIFFKPGTGVLRPSNGLNPIE